MTECYYCDSPDHTEEVEACPKRKADVALWQFRGSWEYPKKPANTSPKIVDDGDGKERIGL